MKITTLWVDAALRLDAKDLRLMTRIVQSQSRLKQSTAIAIPAAGETQATQAR